MSVYKRGKVWYYDFTLNGTRHNNTTQARSKRVAEDIERKIRSDLLMGNHGMIAPKLTPVFKAFAEGKFLDYVRVRSAKKPRTVKYYEEKIRRLLEYGPIATAHLKSIQPDLIEDYVQFRAKSNKKIATINRELAALRHALRLAEEWGLLNRAPKIRLLPGEEGRIFVLGYAMEELYLKTAPQPINDVAVMILDTGMRPEELLTRKWEHIHFEPVGSAKFGYVAITEGKTPNAKRNVPLSARSKTLLERRFRFHEKAGWVFPGQRKGKHLTIYGVDNIHAKIRLETITEDGSPVFPREFVVYSLRHTFGTRLGESGADPYVIMRLMGHSSIVISQKYVHPTPEHVERAMARKEVMDKLMRGESGEVDPTRITTGGQESS
jgi:integrase